MWGFASSERERELARVQLWLGTYGADVSGTRRSYDVSPLGPVGAVEKWLLSVPARLEPFGYAVSFDTAAGGRWVGTQVRLDDRSTLDLSGYVTRGLGMTSPGDLVVVDLAATAVGPSAVDRLMRHVYSLRRRTSTALVHGLLIADGVSVSARRALWEQGFDYVSLSELGFRDYLATRPDVSRVLDTSDGSLPHPTSLHLDLPV
jgi:hypothetical protein